MVRHRRECNLVIADNMNRASNIIRHQVLHLQIFVHDALACKGPVAMDENSDGFILIGISCVFLDGSGHAIEDRVDRF